MGSPPTPKFVCPPPSPVAICSRGELEDFLSEAVCMKEFDHPNVMKLIGEGGPQKTEGGPGDPKSQRGSGGVGVDGGVRPDWGLSP